ncbi:MAG: type II-B CRISPR-associated RNA-guided endonuclease Cas9/Csx12 [Leptospiraceae bacterium]|nr:type II-B CRISPR-associated RNA-guided endonuclease Cas9/Csx12 [Leptospiraceae bacterium]MCK6382487.1 type II-B CRISPR-associated RNA-guided endonuclease Cas9/Csx12 [Leptospiraceae bacterium]NUM41664.1 type II-B CRISPR-associated RNA-guided endonuclease Cas9/Csx12 [Leptospiraceae bacterium]
MKNYISPISLDLGALNTGAVFTHFIEGEEPDSHNGVTFVLAPNDFQVSQSNRLVNRHRMRGEQRRKLAKRLFFLILEEEYGLTQKENKLWEFIRGLLNRRGFTYIQEEGENDTVETIEIPIEFAKFIFPEQFKKIKSNQNDTIVQYIHDKANGEEKDAISFWKTLRDEKVESRLKEFQEDFSESYTTNECKKFLSRIREISDRLIKEFELGNKHRKKYFEEIYLDLKEFQLDEDDPDFSPKKKPIEELLSSAKKKISLEEFYKLIGHISNLQLRVLRKYFNDKKMSEKDYWDKDRLKKYFILWLKSWHIKKDSTEKENQYRLIYQAEKENKDIFLLFFENSPETTIPPYEDQNNRRPPKCQNLLLSEKILNQNYSGWKEVTNIILREKKDDYGLINIPELIERYKSGNSNLSICTESISLQRILEKSISLDNFKIRQNVRMKSLTNEELNNKYSKNELKLAEDGLNRLKSILSESQIELLFNIANSFYREIQEARAGYWNENSSMLQKCESKPRHKSKSKKELVSQILGIKLNEEEMQKFIEKVWMTSVKGKSTVKSLCKGIEDYRKKYGNLFSEYYSGFEKRLYAISKSNNVELNESFKILKSDIEEKIRSEKSERYIENLHRNLDDYKEFVSIHEKVTLISEIIGKHFSFNQTQVSRFENPFSLAQLSNIIDGEQHGFSNICFACQKENSWRGEIIMDSANATQLTSDTGRPFDGQLDRILKRLSIEITKEKFSQLESHFQNGDNLEIPILMENNQFSFTEELNNLKGASKKAKEKVKRGIEKFHDRLISKEERIKKDSGGLCPYTGEKIGKNGEIDHIYPRSKTIGTVFNSELNLIYTSQMGNQKKGNKLYSLKNIHENFLNKHFKTSEVPKVKEKIKNCIDKVVEKNKIISQKFIIPDRLENFERLCFKLAMFDDDLRNRVSGNLQTHSRALVNGTQVWLFKLLKRELQKQIQKKYPKSEVKILPYYFGTREDDFALSGYRKKLSTLNPNYEKQENQPEPSHIVDATMVFAHALTLSSLGRLSLKSPLIKDNTIEDGKWLESLLPEEIKIKNIKRKLKYRKENPESSSLFKAGMFSERFLSILVNEKGIRFGFTGKKSGKFIDKKFNQIVFEKLKPFLLYKSNPVTENLEHYLKLEKNPKYSILKIHRDKAKEYLQRCPKEDEIGNYLESLRYMTQNKNIFDDKGNFTPPEVNSKEKFIVKIGKEKISEFEIQMPYLDEWKKLSLLLKTEKDPEKKIEIAKKYFHEEKIKNPNRHGKTSRKLSLPIKKEPSGGFRIRRKDPFNNFVYQIHEGETQNLGFSKESENINFKNSVLHPIYNSKNVTPYKLEEKGSYQEIVYFDEWRKLQISDDQQKAGIVSIDMAPGTKSRCYLQVIIQRKNFDEIVFASNSSKLEFYKLKTSGKKDSDDFQNLSDFLKKEIADQRDFIKILHINQTEVKLEYTVNGFPSSLKNLYDKGEKINL